MQSETLELQVVQYNGKGHSHSIGVYSYLLSLTICETLLLHAVFLSFLIFHMINSTYHIGDILWRFIVSIHVQPLKLCLSQIRTRPIFILLNGHTFFKMANMCMDQLHFIFVLCNVKWFMTYLYSQCRFIFRPCNQ